MRLGLTLKWGVLGLAVATLVLLAAGTKPVRAGPGPQPLPFPSGALGPLPPPNGPTTLSRLISCPNYTGRDNNQVDISDVVAVVSKYRADYPDTLAPATGQRYWFLMDAMGSGGKIRIDDVTYVVLRFHNICPALDTQIAKATQALANQFYTDKLCNEAGNYTTPVNCGGDPRFLTEHAPCIPNDPDPDCGFLDAKGYRRGSTDVPGQGVHYINYAYWNGVFNPVRPPGLVYKNGHLAAQLYYAAGDIDATIGGSAGVGWGPNQSSDTRGVNIDAFPCTPPLNEPTTGYIYHQSPTPLEAMPKACSWDGTNDGFHWHANLCTLDIGTSSAIAIPNLSESSCMFYSGTGVGQYNQYTGVTCTAWASAANFNCAWAPAVGWMGHMWNWYPNASFTLGASPGPTCVHCSTAESNGRFADCFPDGTNDATRGAYLNGAISATDPTININNTFGTNPSGLAGAGYAYISDGSASEFIHYTANSGIQLTGVVRGVAGSAAAMHASGLAINRATVWTAYDCPQ